jgi:N-acetylmuramoyl-L-alanine amidase
LRKFVLASLVVLLVWQWSGIRSEAAVSFKDVPSNYRAYKEIAYLTEGKIAYGDAGYFYPYRDVSRAEAIAFVGRSIGLNGTKRETQFSDVPMQTFASGYIQDAAEKNMVTSLIADGTFKPDQPITRGEMALVINAAFGYEGVNDVNEAANALKIRGIAQGISAADFGIDLKIKRADFAVFLARAIDYKLRTVQNITYDGEQYVSATDYLNVRKGPSTDFAAVSELTLGTKVQTSYQVGNWMYIKSETAEGFVKQEFLNVTYTPSEGPINPLTQQLVMVDPGHGGKDPGAIGFGLYESHVVLDTGLRLRAILERTPIRVKMTRESNVFYSLSERVQKANAANATSFVSIHANAFSGRTSGTETFYYRAAYNQNWEDSKQLATFIQKRMIQAWRLTNRGVKDGNLYVLRENTMPAALVELGFIDNATDNAKLKSPEWRAKAAEAIYYGILDYYSYKGYNIAKYYNYKILTPAN